MVGRVVFGRITVDYVLELLSLGYHGRSVLDVSSALTLTDEM